MDFKNDRQEAYGELIRKVRLDKRKSLEEISEGIMSYSLLSKFERGETMLTIDKFFKVLEKLNISFNEFELMLNGYQDNPVKLLFNSIKHDYRNQDIVNLKKKKEDELNLFEQSNDQKNRLNYIVVSILIDNLEEQEFVPAEFLLELSDYLFSIEYWTLYELLLYSYAIERLSIQIVLLFSKELLDRVSTYEHVVEFKKIIIKIILNTILKCLKYDFLDEACFFIKAIEKEVAEEFLFEKSILYYIKGLHFILIGDEPTGQYIMDETLEIMKHFDDHQIIEYLKDFYVIM